MAHTTLLHPLDYKQMKSESKNGNALKCVQCKTSVRRGFVCISKWSSREKSFCIYTEHCSSRIHNASTPQNIPSTSNDRSPYLFETKFIAC